MWPFKKEEKTEQYETVLQRLYAAQMGSGGVVTPENCMRSPTVRAIVTAVANRIAISPLHVYQTGEKEGRATKEKLPNHPVAKLLKKPNNFQSQYDFFQDAVSVYMRHGAFIASIGRGQTGPIRELYPLVPDKGEFRHDNYQNIRFHYNEQDIPFSKILYARMPSRDFLKPNSPVSDVKKAIYLEIAAEDMGTTFFENGALPLMMLKQTGSFKNEDDEKRFVESFQRAFSGKNKFKAFLVPKGIEKEGEVPIENDKAQFLETRKLQRNIICGAFGIPPHLAGDLENAHYNNVEQQSEDFKVNAVLPVARSFESALERDLLTDSDRNSGIIIRFNLDGVLRADFKSRQEGLKIQREDGIISANEWREKEGMNPIPEGNDYIIPMNMSVVGAQNGTQSNNPAQNQNP